MNKNTIPLPPPRRNELPITQKFSTVYKLWREYENFFPKSAKYTLGLKIDSLLIESLEQIFASAYVPPAIRLEKVRRAAINLDSARFFLQIAWETKILDTKKYIHLSEKLEEIGRMLGGWLKQLSQRIPA